MPGALKDLVIACVLTLAALAVGLLLAGPDARAMGAVPAASSPAPAATATSVDGAQHCRRAVRRRTPDPGVPTRRAVQGAGTLDPDLA